VKSQILDVFIKMNRLKISFYLNLVLWEVLKIRKDFKYGSQESPSQESGEGRRKLKIFLFLFPFPDKVEFSQPRYT
jgi:hypothetical protein